MASPARHRNVRRGLLLALVILLTPLFGCDVGRTARVAITDFDHAEVRGLWLWFQEDGTEQYVRSSEIRIGEPFMHEDGVEYVEFVVVDPFLANEITLGSVVERDAVDPGQVVIQVPVLFRGDAGSMKASVYNEHGESALSTHTLHYGV